MRTHFLSAPLQAGQWVGALLCLALVYPLGRMLPGQRSLVAAAVVLHTAMTALDVDELEVSPWALREGVLLRYIESLSWHEPA